jgi:CSLREA domain-containing protein
VTSKAMLSRAAMLALTLVAFGAPGAASAATITVNTTADDFGPNATCSLREAVQSVNNGTDFGGCIATVVINAYGVGDEIDVPAGLYKLSRAGAGENANSTGDLDLSKAVNIFAAGDSPAGTEIDANNIDRVLDLQSVAASVIVTVQSLTLSNGNAVAANGGAIRVSDLDGSIKVQNATIESSDAGLKGGAIYFEGATSSTTPINVIDSELVGNSAADDGGAIQYGNSTSQAAIERSSLIGNTAGAEGGGFYLSAPGLPQPSVRIINSTFAGNSAVGGGGAVGLGGGRQQVFSQFSTYAGNSTPAPGQGGAFRTDTGGATADEVYLFATVLAGNTAAGVPASCGGPAGLYPIPNFNVVSDSSCPLAGTDNLLGTDPLLAPLAANGGPTRTMGLYDTSPAINHVPTMNCFLIPMTDQRSQPRPLGAACDAGAFEGSVGPVPPPPAGGGGSPGAVPTPSAPTTPKKKKCKKKKKHKSSANVAKKCKKKKK